MSTSPKNPLDERLDLLASELASVRRWSQFGSNTALIVGLIVIAALCGYFGYFYYVLDRLTEPENAVKSIKGLVDEHAPQWADVAAQEIRESAPGFAKEVSDEFIRKLPEARGRLEATINEQVDRQIEEARLRTAGEFERIVRENHDDFSEAITALTRDSNSEQFVETVMPIFEREYIPGLRYDAIQILGVLDDLDQKFQRLATGQNLNPVEQQMRRILGLTRYIREKEAPHTVDQGGL